MPTSPGRWNSAPNATPWISEVADRLGVAIPSPDSPVFVRLRNALTKNDDLGDELAGWVKEAKGNRKIFDDLLEQRLTTSADLPAPLQRLNTELLSQRPSWAIREKMVVGARAHYRIGDLGRLASGTLGLLDGYRCAPVARVLTMTGSLETATARRLAETSAFMNSVLDSDGMGRASEGFKAAVKVRLVHAFVRHGLTRSPAWNHADWGMPLSIMDSLGTAMSFWMPVVIAAPVLGYTVTDEEAEGMMALWNFVGWLQGVPDDLLPTTLQETYQIYLGILMQIGAADNQSIRLAQAYVGAASRDGDKPNWLREKLILGAAARLMPADHRRELGVRWSPFRYWFDAFRPLVRAQDRKCHSDPAAYSSAVERGRAAAHASLADHIHANAEYDPQKVIRDQTKLAA